MTDVGWLGPTSGAGILVILTKTKWLLSKMTEKKETVSTVHQGE